MTIYEAIGLVANDLGINYLPGSSKEIGLRLIEISKDTIHRSTMWPILCFFTPIELEKDPNGLFHRIGTGTLVLVTETDPQSSTVERLEKYYKPILHPLVENVIDHLKLSKYISQGDVPGFDYTWVDRFYYSATPAKEQNKFAWVADAVELKDFVFNLKKPPCDRVTGKVAVAHTIVTEAGFYIVTESKSKIQTEHG